MNIMVLGGTKYIGVHLVNKLLCEGHNVTIGTRGLAKDGFGQRVERLTLDRHDDASLHTALKGRAFDVIYDNLCYDSNDIKRLFDAVEAKRYVLTSSRGVYHGLDVGHMTDESGFCPLSHKLEWCSFDKNNFDGITYYEGKRQAETAVFQTYGGVPAVAVRFPIVIGSDDDTKRLGFFVEHIVKGLPMHVVNLDLRHCCIRSDEAGSFLAWVGSRGFTGPVNACSHGSFTIRQVISYIEERTGKKAVFDVNGDAGTCNRTNELNLDNTKAEDIGFKFSNVDAWLHGLLDELIISA